MLCRAAGGGSEGTPTQIRLSLQFDAGAYYADMQRIKELSQLLHQANHAYYTEARPIMTDAEYDRLMDELAALEKANPGLVDPNSPTARVGSPVANTFAKRDHHHAMLSLAKVFSAEEIFSALEGESDELLLEPKIDGASLSLIYSGGLLAMAITRGDGSTGDDVTANARTIRSIPLVIDFKGDLEVRGEVYLAKKSFAKLNAKMQATGEELFANARNAAAGSLKQKDARICAGRGLDFIAYHAYGLKVVTHDDILCALDASGFKTTRPHSQIVANRLDRISEVLENHFKPGRATLPFEADGVVAKLNRQGDQQRLGNATRSPRWAVAFKFENETAVTRLLAIKLTVGRTGQITPNAVLAPVELGGATVKAASLCNADEIARLGVNAGDDVVVEKCGDIIPMLRAVANKKSTGVWQMPATCPTCAKPLERDGVHYFCRNYACPDRVFWRLLHAVGKGCLDWDGMGAESIRRWIEAGVTKLSHLLGAPVPVSFSTSAARRFSEGREKVKSAALWRKIAALGIEDVGQTSSKELAAKFNSLEAMVEAGRAGLLPILGPVATESFLEFIQVNLEELDALDQYGMQFQAEAQPANKPAGALAGKSFVITGTMMSGKRPQVAAWIESQGGEVKGGVNKGVNYLVVGDGGGNNKAAAAQKLGTTCISESELYQMAGMEVPVAKMNVCADDLA